MSRGSSSEISMETAQSAAPIGTTMFAIPLDGFAVWLKNWNLNQTVILVGFAVLLATTVAAPEPGDGYSPILPPSLLSLGRAVGRLGVLLAIGYAIYLNATQRRCWRTLALLSPFVAYCVFGVLSTLWSPLPSITLVQSISFSIAIGFAWLIGLTWESKRDTENWVGWIIGCLALTSAGLLALRFGFPKYGALTKEVTGIFHSTAAGSTASLGIVLVIWSATCSCRWWSKWSLCSLPLHLACILVGGNRFSLVAFVLAATLVYVCAVSRRTLGWTWLGGGLLALVYFLCDPGFVLLDQLFAKIAEALSQGQTSKQLQEVSGRSDMWAALWKHFGSSPFVGYGYFVTSPSGEFFMWDDWGNWTAHNVWLQSLVTMGILGTLLLVWGMFSIATNIGIKAIRSDLPCFETALLVSGLAAWFLTWSLINESFLGVMQPETLIFSLLIGLGCGLCRQTRPTSESLMQPAVISNARWEGTS